MATQLRLIGLIAVAALSIANTCVAADPNDPAPGRLIPVDGRKLHILCKGTGGPTVVIEPGGGVASKWWWPVQDRVAAFARVCTYDRAGYGWSEQAPAARSILDRARELHAVLEGAGERGPYVLVGHSYGGLIIRAFTGLYPSAVAGMVLVDAAEEEVVYRPEVLSSFARQGAAAKAREAKIRSGELPGGVPLANEYAAMVDEGASYQLVPSGMRGAGGFGDLGERPLVVIAHGKPFTGDAAFLEPPWPDGQRRLVSLSRRGKLVTATESDHNTIMISQPDLIVGEIKGVVAAATALRP